MAITKDSENLYSSMRFVGDGATKRVPLTFDLREGDGLAVDFGEGLVTSGYLIDYDVTPVVVLFSEPLPKGKTITIRRLTKIDTVKHIFQWTGNAQGGADFSAKNVDENFEQITRASQDAMDSQTLASETLEEMAGIRDTAIDARDKAKVSEGNAKASETNAKTSETNASNSASRARDSENLAKKWANNPEDVVVQDGEFSAKHWAGKAKEIANFDPTEYRKKDDLLFKGMMQVQATDDVGTGVFLLDKEGNPRGQMTSNSGGLQFAQHNSDGTSKTYTLPVVEGELVTTSTMLYTTPEMFGAVGNGIADDSLPLSEAIAHCISEKLPLVLGGSYRYVGAVENLWSVPIMGGGKLIRGVSTTLDLSGDTSKVNTIYVSNAGLDTADGLTSDTSLQTIQRAIDIISSNLLEYTNKGTWKVIIAEGTYDKFKVNTKLLNSEYFTITGTLGSDGSHRTFITTATLNAIGISIRNGNKVAISNLTVKAIKGTNGQGIVGEDLSDVYCIDVMLTGMGWCGASFVNGGRARFQGGNISNCRIGLRAYSSVTYTFGYNSSSNRTQIQDCTTGILVQNSCNGHVDYTDISGCPQGLFLVNQSRANLMHTFISKCTIAITATGNSNYILTGSSGLIDNTRDTKLEGFSLPNDDLSCVYYNPIGKVHVWNNPVNAVNASTSTGFLFKLDPTKQWFDITSEASNLGLRFLGNESNASIAYRQDLKAFRLAIDGDNAYTATKTYLAPFYSDEQTLGTIQRKWSVVYAQTGSINTSDKRAKDNIDGIPDTVLDAWATVNFKSYVFKGRSRTHFGVIAQEVADAFHKHGLDAFQYGLLCYDEWVNEEGIKESLYGIRYEEALVLECALMRRELTKLKQG